MQYFFIPGIFKDLSYVELLSVCNVVLSAEYDIEVKSNYFILRTEKDSKLVSEVFNRLGGFIKFGKILSDDDVLFDGLNSETQLDFGVSIYSESDRELMKLLRSIKNTLKDMGIKSRYVLPKSGVTLSSAQIINNHLIEKGREFNILDENWGITLGVQDIDSFTDRDFGKPFGDKTMGMLPLKLARMMVNFCEVKEGDTVWDPFCGSGNTLIEALAIGMNVIGSDIDKQAIYGARENLGWLKGKYGSKGKMDLYYLDVFQWDKEVIKKIREIGVNGIVCEPYMGPPQRRVLNPDYAQKLIKSHLSSVKALFNILEKLQLSKKIRVVVIFPEYKTTKGWVSADIDFRKKNKVKLVDFEQKDLHWERTNSIIRRLIKVFDFQP